MTLIRADRVLEVTATTGVGAYTLAGTEAGYQAFAAVCSSSDTIECVVTDDVNWEAGLYTFTPGSLARTSIYASSNGGSAVNWGAGNKTIFNDIPAHFFANPIPTAMNPVLTGDVTSPGGSTATTLATVNASPGAYTNASVTVNAKGLVTVASSGTAPVTSVSGTTNRITSTGGATPVIDISASYVGQASITTVGTLASGAVPLSLVTGLGTGVATALAVNVGTSGSPVVNGGALGTPSSGVATNLTGTASGLTAGNVTTNANLTGPITSSGNATSIAAQTGTGTTFVTSVSPTISTSLAVSGTETITSNSANALTVGANGTTNPVFNVKASTASVATGIDIQGAASGSQVTFQVTSSGSNDGINLTAKGTGPIRIANTSSSTTLPGTNPALQIRQLDTTTNAVSPISFINSSQGVSAQIIAVHEVNANASGTGSLKFYTFATGTGVLGLNISSAQVITLPNLAGTGSRAVLADASGVLSAPVSDESVKENITSLDYGLDTIMAMRPVSFEYIKDYKNHGAGKQIGFIAQEMQKIVPEVVFSTPSTGLLGINNIDPLVAVLVRAIQEQQVQIDDLRKQIGD